MPKIFTNIVAQLITPISSNTNIFSTLEADIQDGQYIKTHSLIGFIQDFREVEYSEKLSKPINFGFKNQYNAPMQTLNISY